ncbi:hypothetical protein BDZ94DRAFT_1248929 [Collybia nuda]|uniref:Queuosine 5'-phosphate N-glycosylase/hydrolase n=1 Tax=Collybia nuda TaxID=64659 RepID=A0A9P5YEW9_9AGAR|nr:hypothetical protein BDZ94DRAFT_1248929 [Collybia nuda]
MQTIAFTKVAELLSVNVHIERPHESILGLTVGELGGPMYELVQLITTTLNKTGEILVDMGYPNFGTFVAESLKAATNARSISDSTAELDVVLERLVRAIPAFQDMAEVNGQPIYCFKKALFLIHAISVRFGSITPPPFPIPSTIGSPVFTDNVLPSMLIHLGIIDLSASPSLSSLFPNAGSEGSLKTLLDVHESTSVPKSLPKEGPVLTSHQAYILRAAAIDACELIVEEAQNLSSNTLPSDNTLYWIREITLPDLDMWIWAVAKDRADYRALERFVLRDTVFF